MNTKTTSKRTKSRTQIYNLTSALIILAISILPYLHDFGYFDGKEGFSGFSSLRVSIWTVSLFVVAISGWAVAFANSKGKQYRFAILAPVFMLIIQLAIYVLDQRQSFVNELNTKVIVNFAIVLIIVLTYFKFKK